MLLDLITHLRASVPALKDVRGAAGWMKTAKTPPPLAHLPMAYVIPLAETAEPNRSINAVSQRLHTHIGVVLAVAGLEADSHGESASFAIEGLRAAVKNALEGWQIDAAHRPFEFVQGQLLELDGQVLWWLDGFVTTSQMRNR